MKMSAAFKQATEMVGDFGKNKKDRIAYEEREKSIRDFASQIYSAAKEGEKRGRANSFEKEFAKGFEKGFVKSFEKGFAIGLRREALKIAKKLCAQGMSPDFIMNVTGLSKTEVLKLK